MAHLLRYAIWPRPVTESELAFMRSIFDLDGAVRDLEEQPVSIDLTDDVLVGVAAEQEQQQQQQQQQQQNVISGASSKQYEEKEGARESASTTTPALAGQEVESEVASLAPKVSEVPSTGERLLHQRPRRPRSSTTETKDEDTCELNGMELFTMTSQRSETDPMANEASKTWQHEVEQPGGDIEVNAYPVTKSPPHVNAQIDGTTSTPDKQQDLPTPPDENTLCSETSTPDKEPTTPKMSPKSDAPSSPMEFGTPKTGMTPSHHDRGRTTTSTDGADSLQKEMRKEEPGEEPEDPSPVPFKYFKARRDDDKDELALTSSESEESELSSVPASLSARSPPAKRQKIATGKQTRRQKTTEDENAQSDDQDTIAVAHPTTKKTRKQQPQNRQPPRRTQSDIAPATSKPQTGKAKRKTIGANELKNLGNALGADAELANDITAAEASKRAPKSKLDIGPQELKKLGLEPEKKKKAGGRSTRRKSALPDVPGSVSGPRGGRSGRIERAAERAKGRKWGGK